MTSACITKDGTELFNPSLYSRHRISRHLQIHTLPSRRSLLIDQSICIDPQLVDTPSVLTDNGDEDESDLDDQLPTRSPMCRKHSAGSSALPGLPVLLISQRKRNGANKESGNRGTGRKQNRKLL